MRRFFCKKYWLVFSLVIIFSGGLYVWSYWYLRAKTIHWEKTIDRTAKSFILPAPGYYFEIDFGVGLGTGNGPGYSVQIFPYKITSENKPEFKLWMGYFYYPLWRSEVTIWRIKTFGW